MRKEASKMATNASPSTKLVNKLIEALMVKTGIKSGPEFTGGN